MGQNRYFTLSAFSRNADPEVKRMGVADMAEQKQTLKQTWGRVADYMFGRNTLIGIASLMLLVISGYATWSGMHDFIVGVATSPANQGRELPGGLSVTNDMLVIAIVVALTFLMWLALRETFGAGRSIRDRALTLPLYLFLALWSIGFGYGFWWSLIAGEEATRTSLSGLQQDARDAGNAVAARLDAVRAQLDNVVTWSESQMAREESSGGSCGVPSGAGRGPLYNARASVRDSVASLRDSIKTAWIGPVQADLKALQESVAGLSGGTVAERQENFEQKASTVRSKALAIAARSNEFGQSTASEMHALAVTVSIKPGKPGFSCYDPTLAQRLRQAATQAGQAVSLKLREASFNEGPAGVANAVKNLWANIGSTISSIPSYFSSDSRSPESVKGTPISGRDMIALLATIGVDLGLFVLTALNPPSTPPMSAPPSQAVIDQVRKAMKTAIARAPNASMEWVRRHFIHHNKASYFVIPNMFSCNPDDKEEYSRALAMNQLAGVLDDLDLVRWPTKRELAKLKKEESKQSLTDLTGVRKRRLEELERRIAKGENIKINKEKAERIRTAEPVRNHGLFSKAERVLEVAGWSEQAQDDIEIFKLVDTEGLTPLLIVLSEDEPKVDKKADMSSPATKDGGDLTDGAQTLIEDDKSS